MPHMSPIDLDAIEARANAATPGPLYAGPNYLIGGWWVQTEEDKRLEREHGDFLTREDAEFFAHAREDVPALVAEVRRLRRDIRKYGQHIGLCRAMLITASDCDCGLEEARAIAMMRDSSPRTAALLEELERSAGWRTKLRLRWWDFRNALYCRVGQHHWVGRTGWDARRGFYDAGRYCSNCLLTEPAE